MWQAQRSRRFLLAVAAFLLVAAPLLPHGESGAATSSIRTSMTRVTRAAIGGTSLIELRIRSSKTAVIDSISIQGATSSALFIDGNMCDGDDVATKLRNVVVPAGATVEFSTRRQEAVSFGLSTRLVLHTAVHVEITTTIGETTSTTTVAGRVIRRPPRLTLPSP